ncbi:MAG: hypothetical protein ACTSPN_01420 [Promethearchaeota archaeon]
MNEDIGVSRKTVGEDRIAICPLFGCEYMTRVKPLKFRFFGFGKHPKCKKHHLSLVYVDEMIGNFTDAALACFFDKSALPPSKLLEEIRTKFPQELETFVRGWIYCITSGRGAPIVSRYMDGISNGYLKQLTRKQKKALKKRDDANLNKISKAIKDGMKEIINQYTRLLKHLRTHSEILNDHQKLRPLSKSLRNYLNDWQKNVLKNNKTLNSPEIKHNYDEILNVCTVRCLLGLNIESKEIMKAKMTAFDRFSAYLEFHKEGLTEKFTKSEIKSLVKIGNHQQQIKTQDEEYYEELKNLSINKNQMVENESKENDLNKDSNKIIIGSPSQGTIINIETAQHSELYEQFLHYTHKNDFLNQIITEFNKSRNWIKNFKPTKSFLNYLAEKKENLENEDQLETLSNYIILILKIMEEDVLNKVIRDKIANNKGKYNAYNIQEWLLISDTAARNFLKKIYPNETYENNIRTQTHVSIDTVKEIAKKKGGKCLSTTIKNAKSKIQLECTEGHKFSTTYNSLVYSNTWCPDCNIYVSETICRQFLEHIFKRPFPKSYPPWLVNKNGNQMEVDMYNKYLAVAGEYQGIQHRKKAFGLTDKDIKKIQKEDAYKLEKCEENGVTLLQIPDDEIVPYDKMQEFIVKEYERKSGKSLGTIPKFDYRQFSIYENEYAKKFRNYVEEKGGTLLTPYFAAKKEVTLLCEQGHEWTTTPDSIYKDNWCSECAGNKKGTTEEFQEIGKMFDCELIDDYVNAKTSLNYKCKMGHIFTRNPQVLKENYENIENLCPECESDSYANKFEELVQNKGGLLLNPYNGRFKPIKIRCENGHEWETTPGAVYQGRWCKICADENHPNKERQQTAKDELIKMIEALNYTLLSEYENNTKKVKIKCGKNHQFTMTPKYFKRLVNQNTEPCYECRKEN